MYSEVIVMWDDSVDSTKHSWSLQRIMTPWLRMTKEVISNLDFKNLNYCVNKHSKLKPSQSDYNRKREHVPAIVINRLKRLGFFLLTFKRQQQQSGQTT